MKRTIVVILAIVGTGLGLVLAGAVWLKPAVLGLYRSYFTMEYATLAEFARKASSSTCSELRLFALMRYLDFLEDYGDLVLMQTNDLNYAMFSTHARLFRLYTAMNDDVNAQQHFLAASNFFRLLKMKPLERQFLLTNVAFQVEHQ